MKKCLIFTFSVLLIVASLALNLSPVNADISVTATVTACGTPQEQCNGGNLNGETCQSRGFGGGTLSCTSLCTFDTSQCSAKKSSGGGGQAPLPATLYFEGLAYPDSKVTILKFGEIIGEVYANAAGFFFASFPDFQDGIYTFGFWGTDQLNRKSITFSFPMQVLSGTLVSIKNIFLPPTISIDKKYLLAGDTLKISGTTYAGAEITLFLTPSPKTIIPRIKANSRGEWSYLLRESFLDFGSWTLRAQASSTNFISPFSQALSFSKVREIPLEPEPVELFAGQIADFNADLRVDIIDFSILFYWWDQELTEPVKADINKDGKVDVADFSIMMYYWTG